VVIVISTVIAAVSNRWIEHPGIAIGSAVAKALDRPRDGLISERTDPT